MLDKVPIEILHLIVRKVGSFNEALCENLELIIGDCQSCRFEESL